jgi:hypothetical protein
MKKTTIFVCAMLFATVAFGGDEKYYQKMGETLKGFSNCTSVEDYQNLANKFRVIANVEKEEWLPLYYEAHCYILISFMEGLSAEEKDAYLDKASSLIDNMNELAPQEAEIKVLEAFCLTGSLVVNPPQRAMNTTPLIHSAIAKPWPWNPTTRVPCLCAFPTKWVRPPISVRIPVFIAIRQRNCCKTGTLTN